MLTLKVKDKEYKLKFGYKSFKKTKILSEAVAMQSRLESLDSKKKKKGDLLSDVELIEDILQLVSKLVLAALQKFHAEFRVDHRDPESVRKSEDMADDLIDDYMDEEGAMDVMTLFGVLFQELFNEGFLPKNGENPEQITETAETAEDKTAMTTASD